MVRHSQSGIACHPPFTDLLCVFLGSCLRGSLSVWGDRYSQDYRNAASGGVWGVPLTYVILGHEGSTAKLHTEVMKWLNCDLLESPRRQASLHTREGLSRLRLAPESV